MSQTFGKGIQKPCCITPGNLGDAVQSDNELPTNLEQWRPDLQEFQPE